MSIAASLLVLRLDTPDPWVRLEAARAVAAAVRAGDADTRSSFLAWVGAKTLESEAANAVSLVSAFDLGSCFGADELDAVITVPSVLSEALMRDLYPNRGAGSRALGYASDRAEFDPDLRATFVGRQGWYLPPIVSHFLLKLESLGDLLLSRWKFEWCSLQAQRQEPFSDLQALLRGDARANHAFFQVRQTELYASAYLRALAYAAVEHGVPSTIIADLAFHVAPFTGGLAGTMPMMRPDWSVGVTDAVAANGLSAVAEALWEAAEQSLPSSHALLAVHTVETLALGLTSLTVTLTGHSRGAVPTAGNEATEIEEIWLKAKRTGVGRIEGAASATVPTVKLEANPALTACVSPWHLARYHHDFAPQGIRLARPDMIDGDVTVAADCEGLYLEGARGRSSTWRYWSADWAPTRPRGLPRLGGFLTSVSRDLLEEYLARHELATSRHCDALIGSRDYDFGDMEIEQRRVWL